MYKLIGVLFIVSFGATYPLRNIDDADIVESVFRETRAAAPKNIEDLIQPGVKAAYLYSYGDDEDDSAGDLGYHKKAEKKGNDGYKHYDSYHKKDGDKYGYEAHSEYGQENKQNTKGDNGSGEETQKAYKVVEKINEGKNGVRAIDDYDSGFYGDSGESTGYSDADGEHYEEGYEEGDGDSGHYAAEDSGDYDGESQPYQEEDDDDDDDY